MDPNTPSSNNPIFKNEISAPQLAQPDHDLLIKLDTKMDGLANSFNQYYTDLTVRVTKVEARLDKEDLYNAAIPMDRIRSNSDWVDGFRSNWRLIAAIFGFAVAIFGGVVSTVILRWLHI